jgi:hypothetical protein
VSRAVSSLCIALYLFPCKNKNLIMHLCSRRSIDLFSVPVDLLGASDLKVSNWLGDQSMRNMLGVEHMKGTTIRYSQEDCRTWGNPWSCDRVGDYYFSLTRDVIDVMYLTDVMDEMVELEMKMKWAMLKCQNIWDWKMIGNCLRIEQMRWNEMKWDEMKWNENVSSRPDNSKSANTLKADQSDQHDQWK